MNDACDLRHLFISEGHNFFGHHGREAGRCEALEVAAVHCLAGRGIEGDRFFDYKRNYKGQITFFEEEVYLSLCAEFDVWDVPPSVFRRNVITRGVRLRDWIKRDFEVQGVRFRGAEEAKPCFWMNQAFGPGAENSLRGRGGLRARILTDGWLRVKRS